MASVASNHIIAEESLLQLYDREYPGFLDYFSRLLFGYFKVSPRTHPLVAQRMTAALERLGPEVCRQALSEFAQAGIFDGSELCNDQQVRIFWTSPLMHVYRDAIGYAPQAEDELLARYPSPAAGIEDLLERQAAYRDAPLAQRRGEEIVNYWSEVLLVNAPELYLKPFLKSREGPLQGLDLGCGWGRGALAMHDHGELSMTCVDLNQEELELLKGFAVRAGLTQRFDILQADITELPLANDSHDFALTYVVLDLLSDEALDKALREVLRCLKVDSPFYVDIPTDRFCGSMMLQRQSRRGFIDLLHGIREHGKLFQLAYHDVRMPMQYTFGVFEQGVLPISESGRRRASLVAQAAARLQGEEAQSVGWRERLKGLRAGSLSH